MTRPLVILGCGFAGAEVARLGLEEDGRTSPADGRVSGRTSPADGLVSGRTSPADSNVVGTTRTAGPVDGVLGRIDRRVVPVLTREAVEALVPPGARVLVGFPPDGETDRAIAPALASARVVYVSTTGV